MSAELQNTIAKLSEQGKGILAADESTGTITKRFDSIGAESTEENRRSYRDILFTTPNLGDYICGAILFEETLMQQSNTGKSIPETLRNQGIIPGIKVDKGLIELANGGGQKTTQGLDGLPDRFAQYKEYGAKFAKWRVVYNISDNWPTRIAIRTNAEGLARYAAICQSMDIVPIVEPEVLMTGSHSIERCMEVTQEVQNAVFTALRMHKVSLEHMILKPNMVIMGEGCPQRASHEQIAEYTLKVLRRTTPAAVPTINFLSGGQSDEDATMNLQAMNAMSGSKPWHLSYSYGRALQATALKAWQGDSANAKAAQDALLKRAKLNSAATNGTYAQKMERADTATV